MSDQYDGFGDILQNQTGIFGSDTPGLAPALHQHDTARTVPRPDGVHVTMHCPDCGATQDVTMEWGEVAAISMNIPPQHIFDGWSTPWAFTHQGWTPAEMKCSTCRGPSNLHPYITQPEASGHIKHGQSQGWPYFHPPGASRYDQVVNVVRQRAAGARR